MVEGWLGHLQKLALGRGSFRSVPELKRAILDYVEASNGRAEPWCWAKDAQETLRKDPPEGTEDPGSPRRGNDRYRRADNIASVSDGPLG
ncbi:hypothetical protein B1A_11207, partial [mine drainage metagenome]